MPKKKKEPIKASNFTEDEWNNLTKKLEERLEERREYERNRIRSKEQKEKINASRRVANMTQEKIDKQNKYARDARKNESPEKREERLKKERIRDKIRKPNRTEEQKEARREHAREKIKCEICNVEIRRDSISKHIKSKTHLKKLEEYNKNQAIKELDQELAEQLL